MARVKQRIYPGSKERTMESMLEVCVITLEELGMEVTTQFLDKSLIECIGKPPAGSPLGKQNRVTVYKEGDNIYIKLTYEMKDPSLFWNQFEVNLQIHGANTEEIERKAKVITKICTTIRQMGGEYELMEEDAWDFLYNYEKQNKHLPADEEIQGIAIEYIKILDEMGLQNEDEEDVFVEEDTTEAFDESDEEEMSTEPTGPSPSEALRQMIQEIPTLDEETITFYFSLFDQLVLADQEKLVKKIKAIEADLNRVPYLMDDERKELRNQVYQLSKQKRQQKLIQNIKERQKKKGFYMARYMDFKIQQDLAQYPFLDAAEINEIMNVILTLPFDDKRKAIARIGDIEKEFAQLGKKGVTLSEIEKKNLRLDLIRLSQKERIEQYDSLIEDSRRKIVEKHLFEAIPQLQFEDNAKLVKELIWLNFDEMKARITKIQHEMDKKSQEKSDLFQKSSAGSACPKCGWPMGQFSKKCPRCGYNPDDEWFDLD